MEQTTSRDRRFFILMVSATAALAGLLFGFDTGVISGAILFIRHDFALTSHMIGIVVSAVLLGAFMGAIISGRLADQYGRKRIIILTAIIFTIGSLACAYASTVNELIFGRWVLGVAIGIASYTAPLYLAEIAPYKMRGMLVSLNQLAITIGILSSYFVDYHYAATHAWRWMLGVGVVPAIILCIGMFMLPESPRWLAKRGKINKAKSILQRIRPAEAVTAELDEIQQTLKQNKGSWRELFSRKIRPVIWVAAGLALFQQVTGINTIIYYAPTIFKMAGFHSAQTAILATIGVGVANVLFTLLGLPLIDKLGRRPLLLIGLGGMFISLMILGHAFHVASISGALRWITLASLLLFIASFAISFGPIMWLVIAEIFPLNVRGIGMSLATAVNWASNMLVALTFLSLISFLGVGNTFYLFAFISIVNAVFVISWVPETKNCTLEQIEMNLLQGKPTRQLGQPVGVGQTRDMDKVGVATA